MMLLHEFYSDDDCSRGDSSYRKALVFKEPDGSYTGHNGTRRSDH